MLCPSCHGSDIARSRRQGLMDWLKSRVGLYPYRCLHCLNRFSRTGRFQATAATKQNAPSEGAKAVVATDTTKPTAQVVIQAESQAQLDHVLLALSHAVTSYNRVSRPQPKHQGATATDKPPAR